MELKTEPKERHRDFLSNGLSHISGSFLLLVLQNICFLNLFCTLSLLALAFLLTGRDLPYRNKHIRLLNSFRLMTRNISLYFFLTKNRVLKNWSSSFFKEMVIFLNISWIFWSSNCLVFFDIVMTLGGFNCFN